MGVKMEVKEEVKVEVKVEASKTVVQPTRWLYFLRDSALLPLITSSYYYLIMPLFVPVTKMTLVTCHF